MILQTSVNIRPARIEDSGFIVESQLQMAMETEQMSLDKGSISEGVKAVFNDNSKGFYIIAEANNLQVGCLLITPEWSDWRNAWVWWIQSVYVKQDFRKLGVFGTMYDYIKTMVIMRNDVSGIRLYVDKTNQSAMNVYCRVGMNGEHYSTFEWMK
ncbi:MAG: GNAT family N-acetyltransferase [Lentimicrobium sp.]|nr:GNAT family N-acetyltransferase [Lentimicrobium sp.]